MKKTFKRAGVAVLSMAMLLSMGAMTAITSNAAYSTGNGGLTVTSTASEIKAYKVAEFTSGSWQWVTGLTSVDATDMATVTNSSTTQNAPALKTIADKLASDSHLPSPTSITAGVEADLAPGYYLLVSKGAGTLYQNKLIEVKKDTSVTLSQDKSSPVTVNKTITTVSDNGTIIAGTNSKKATAKDKATVTYSIVTDIPTYSEQATTTNMHDYVIVDDYDDTFTDISITSVVIDTTTPTTLTKVDTEDGISGDSNVGKYYLSTANIASGNKGFTIKVNKKSILDNGGKHVTVTFTAKLNADTRANYEYPNDVSFTYDNTFNATGGEDTLTSDADVYSVPIKIYKTDGTNAITSADGQFKISGGGIEQTVTLDATGYAKFDSLPAGTYTITEETAPAGYKKIEGTAATVTIAVSDEGVVTVTGATLDNTDKYYSTTITNTPQEALPGTGGMGTILFTVGGAAVVLLAGALFVVYMRRRKVEE